MTPEAAAKLAGCSRPAIMSAINSGALTAKKNNKNRWDIHEEALRAWMSNRKPPTENLQQLDSNLTVSATESQLSEVLHANNILQVKLEAAEKQIQDLKEDRDQWRETTKQLLAAPPQKEGRGGFFASLFRRGER